MHEGTRGHKDALKLNFSMDKTSMDNGLAGSSAAQHGMAAPTKAKTDPTDKDKVTWGDEKMTSETKTKNTKGGEDTKRTYETKGTSSTYTPPKKTPEGDAKYAAMSKAERKAADDKYRAANTKTKTHTKGREENESTVGKTPKTPKKSTTPETPKETPKKTTPKKRKYEYERVEEPKLFKRGTSKTTNTETGKTRTYKTKSKTGKFFEKVGQGIKNAVPKKKFKNKRRGKPSRKRMTQCNF